MPVGAIGSPRVQSRKCALVFRFLLDFVQVEQFSEDVCQWHESIAEACTIEHPMLRSLDYMTLRITNLTCNTSYQFRVIAANQIGRSEKGQPSSALKTLQSVPAPPSNVRITHVWSDRISLIWNLPHIDGGSAIEGSHIEQACPLFCVCVSSASNRST